MKLSLCTAALLVSSSSAFVPANTRSLVGRTASCPRDVVSVKGLLKDDLDDALNRQMAYIPGKAKSDLADRFGYLAGAKIKTVAQAFSDFTDLLQSPVNALYKNYVTDIVGQTHLVIVNARFKRDGIWSLGLMSALNLVLKNYPEKDLAEKVVKSLCECLGMDEADIRAEAKEIEDWVAGKTKDDITEALKGNGDNPISKIAAAAKSDKFWMYSKYYGLGLVKIMETVGVEMEMEKAFPVMEEWVGTSMEKPFYTACSDSDSYFRIKAKIDQMETLMREVEIREKKRFAQRLEDKAEAALSKAEREKEMKSIEAAEVSSKQ